MSLNPPSKLPSRFKNTGISLITLEAPTWWKRALKKVAAERGSSIKWIICDAVSRKYPKDFKQPTSEYVLHGDFPKEEEDE